ncbi:hypothetical protein GOV11_04390 [Candidatus Woesearchaeota archaeon]|nr:hypothetical protein [Candidatus Woesearchaeota archaeon]
MDNVLTKLGLSEGERKTYLALLEKGPSTSGPLAKAALVSPSKIYQILGRLLRKGFVSEYLENGTKHFRASHPRAILDYLGEQQNELEKLKQSTEDILPALEAKFEAKVEETEVQMTRGWKGLRNTFYGMLEDVGSGGEYFVIGANRGMKQDDRFSRFIKHYHVERNKKEISANLLFQEGTEIQQKWVDAEMRFMPSILQSPLQINIHKETTEFVLMVDDPVIFTIRNRKVAEAFMQYFESLWVQSKVIPK